MDYCEFFRSLLNLGFHFSLTPALDMQYLLRSVVYIVVGGCLFRNITFLHSEKWPVTVGFTVQNGYKIFTKSHDLMAQPWPEDTLGQAKSCFRLSFWPSLAWPIWARLGWLFGLRPGWNNTSTE